MDKREFTVAGEYRYNRDGAARWIVSHVLRYKGFVATFLATTILLNVLTAVTPTLTGTAFDIVLGGDAARGSLARLALVLLAVIAGRAGVDLAGRCCAEILGKRLERDARDELYISLLGKSQTFHNRQRVGDIMARAANDVQQLSNMIVPGVDLIVDSSLSLVVPIIFIGFLEPQLLLAPLLFTITYVITLRDYTRRLGPVSAGMRERFGDLNAGLAETVTGIEVVKSTAQEAQEARKFARSAGAFRDAFVRNGEIQARYLPPLLLAVALVGAFLHGVLLLSRGQLSVGDLVSYMGLMGLLRFPTFISIFTFSLVQLGAAGARRILAIMAEESDLDENEGGHRAPIRGEIVFDRVSFGYGPEPVLRDLSFRARAGETVAIVGQTGSGKSTLTKLVNRIYDVGAGRVLIDGIDARDWSLGSLRSQVSTIEQDIFLFSRSIAENIAFGLGPRADRAAIERAARDAQAHDFIAGFKDGYQTVVGERGVTLSGGQRQRIAIARALLADPRILILDDSTSAVDSATEDRIQTAIARVLEGRTTLLITHRLSQIRRADTVLVLARGTLIDQGTHDELLARCALYRRIFARHGEDAGKGASVGGKSAAGTGNAE